MLEFSLLKEKDYSFFESLAKEIWEEHFTSIIGGSQVAYMLKKFQSSSAIKKQISNGYKYYFIMDGESVLGYFAFKNEETKMFLSKLYLKKEFRGLGYARKVLDFLVQTAKNENLKNIYLTVNINNLNSIKAYEKMGFYVLEKKKMDIGGGFFMDDYIMQKDI